MTQHIAKALVTSANLKQQIRTACHPDDPQLLKRYINLALDSANTAGASSEKIRILLECAALLLETACDQKVVLSWRYQCLDQIYRPLLAAENQAAADDAYADRSCLEVASAVGHVHLGS